MATEATAATGSSAPMATTTTTSAKTVFLIRHAQSLENQRIGSLYNCFGSMSRFSLPKSTDVSASLQLLNIPGNHDAPISEKGLQQCEAMKSILKEHDFVRAQNIELVAHSPLRRARETCQELIGCSTDTVVGMDGGDDVKSSTTTNKEAAGNGEMDATTTTTKDDEKACSAPSSYPEPVQRTLSLELLLEKSQMEWIPGQTGYFEQRVAKFQEWLSQQPESVVCVVGHSQFFKFMLGLPFKFDNCDVYQVSFDAQKTQPNEPVIMEYNGTADLVTMKPQWYDLKLLHTCNKPPAPPTTTSQQGEALAASPADGSESGDTLL